jgi:hypothetical protein
MAQFRTAPPFERELGDEGSFGRVGDVLQHPGVGEFMKNHVPHCCGTFLRLLGGEADFDVDNTLATESLARKGMLARGRRGEGDAREIWSFQSRLLEPADRPRNHGLLCGIGVMNHRRAVRNIRKGAVTRASMAPNAFMGLCVFAGLEYGRGALGRGRPLGGFGAARRNQEQATHRNGERPSSVHKSTSSPPFWERPRRPRPARSSPASAYESVDSAFRPTR